MILYIVLNSTPLTIGVRWKQQRLMADDTPYDGAYLPLRKVRISG